ncbi:MAG: hypothetical protein VX697_09235 [Pseudomonadota bacterium]|nr:hypothetical protein [Pseudomonadota bacterium]
MSRPLANFLDGLVDDLFAASYCHERPLRAVVYIVLAGFTDGHICDATELIA